MHDSPWCVLCCAVGEKSEFKTFGTTIGTEIGRLLVVKQKKRNTIERLTRPDARQRKKILVDEGARLPPRAGRPVSISLRAAAQCCKKKF